MERKNVSFPELLLKRAEKIAQENGVKLTDVVRHALKEYVERYDRMRKTDD